MRPRRNSVEALKASKWWNPLRVRDDLPELIGNGYENLSPADKDLLKWVGVFFRKPTPGKFMMRIRMPNGFATSEQLRAIADLSRRIGNGVLDITTRQQIELRIQLHAVSWQALACATPLLPAVGTTARWRWRR